MNRFACLGCALAFLVGTVEPIQAAFVKGDLVIVTTAANTGDAASAFTLNSYPYDASTGTFGTTPTIHSISGLTLPAASDHEGLLHLSTNGNYLVFGGFQAAPGAPDVVASSAPRAIGVVDSNWNLTTIPIGGHTGLGLRSVVSTDGQHFWTGGDGGADSGQYYIDATTGPITQTLLTADDARGNRIVDGQLWAFNSGNGGTNVGAGLPTTATTSVAAMTSPYVKSDAVFLDLNNDGASETAYTTDGKNLLGKWNYDGAAWSLTGSWTGTKNLFGDINSLEAFAYNGQVKLLAATQIGQLLLLTDANGIAPNFDPAFLANVSPAPFLSAPADSSFRGMAITVGVPEPTSLALLAVAIPLLGGGRRSRGRSCGC